MTNSTLRRKGPSPPLSGITERIWWSASSRRMSRRFGRYCAMWLALGTDLTRNNDFAYGPTDDLGLRCLRGAHIRRANPRDTLVNMGRHRILRSGSTYGPQLPPGTSSEDGVERGIIFLALGTSIGRQFGVVHDQWMGDGFVGLGREADPITGAHGEEVTFTIPRKPVRRKLVGLPRFVTVREGSISSCRAYHDSHS
jgi:deferrochelatase/peroxidase EfeB